MRRLSEVQFEIETVERELIRLVRTQVAHDVEISALDRRRAALQRELDVVNQAQQ